MATLPRELSPDDLLTAVAANQSALAHALDRDWTALAGTLEWDCRKTLDHLVDGSIFYSAQVSNLATARRPRIRGGDPDASVADLLTTVDTVGHILASVLRSAPSDGRFFHPAGMADISGYVGMACVELLAHTFDPGTNVGTDQGAVGFISDDTILYNSAFLVHEYIFEQVSDLNFQDTVGAPEDVAFRDIQFDTFIAFDADDALPTSKLVSDVDLDDVEL